MAEKEKKEAAKEPAKATEEASLLDDIVQSTKLKPSDEAYSITRQGVEAFIDELLKPEREGIKVSPALVDDMISEIDQKLSTQMDAVLHDKAYQKLESAWRSLKFLVDRTDFRENNKIEILSVKKEELLDDFEDAPEITKSGLYRTAYTAEYGQFGGQLYGIETPAKKFTKFND